ncbi:MAG TPA: GAF domain-containing protein [Anaerolineales bacterium]|nr:GAF domain-containing protein [Anaerolineales bacterium]
MSKRFALERLLSKTGGWYILIVTAAAQVIALLGAIPGILSIQVNAEFSEALTHAFTITLPVLIILSNLIMLGISWWITRTAQNRLDQWAKGSLKPNPAEELAAWREITSLVWRYGIAAVIVIFVVNVLPPVLMALLQSDTVSSPFQPTSLSSPNPVYILLGGLAAIFGSVILVVLMIDRFTLPARLVLVPNDFDTQLQGRAGALLIGRFQVLNLALIAIAIVLIAPIGYHQTIRILYAEVSPLEIFSNLQVQSILFSMLALLLGAILSYYASRAVSNPIRELIETFDKIEQGDLSQRAPIIATDELGIVTMHFNRMVSRLDELQNTLEQQVVERTKQLSATNEVGRVASSSLDPDELLAKVILLVPERFGYYYAAIYLLDPSEKWAELKEATGEAGKLLRQNRHRLEVAGRSMVGTAIREKTARIAQIASEEKQRYENPILPYTRSEIALPLIVGDRVLGALNVQSTKESDFGPQVIETMQNMAGQVAIALENARLFQEAQHNIREMRTIQQQYLLEGWSGFTAQKEDELEYQVGDEPDEKSKKIEVSISLRDQVLGQIRFESTEDWTPEQESLANAVATQAAIALENARLISESRQIAVYERMLAEINSKIWSSATIDGVLQTAVKELGRRLSASQATIELNMDESNK